MDDNLKNVVVMYTEWTAV